MREQFAPDCVIHHSVHRFLQGAAGHSGNTTGESRSRYPLYEIP
jgi:hypothetical protein